MNKNYIKGQSLFEVVIAIFIMAMVIIGVVILATNSIANSSFSRNKTLAGRYTQEAIEWLRSQRDADINMFISKISPIPYCLNTLTWNMNTCGTDEFVVDVATGNTIFKREVILSTSQMGLFPNLKNVIEVNVKVFWDDSKGYHEARSATNFIDIRER